MKQDAETFKTIFGPSKPIKLDANDAGIKRRLCDFVTDDGTLGHPWGDFEL